MRLGRVALCRNAHISDWARQMNGGGIRALASVSCMAERPMCGFSEQFRSVTSLPVSGHIAGVLEAGDDILDPAVADVEGAVTLSDFRSPTMLSLESCKYNKTILQHLIESTGIGWF
jgi:hypothetical protein